MEQSNLLMPAEGCKESQYHGTPNGYEGDGCEQSFGELGLAKLLRRRHLDT